MSLNIDLKMILPLNCSGSHFCSFMNSWICVRRSDVVNPGNIFHSSSIDSPSIRFRSFKRLFSKYHLIFSFQNFLRIFFYTSQTPDRAPSLRRRRSWRSRSDEFCHTASLSRSTCILCNQPWSHHWSLSGPWSIFQFLWIISAKNSRNDSSRIVNSDHTLDQDELLLDEWYSWTFTK